MRLRTQWQNLFSMTVFALAIFLTTISGVALLIYTYLYQPSDSSVLQFEESTPRTEQDEDRQNELVIVADNISFDFNDIANDGDITRVLKRGWAIQSEGLIVLSNSDDYLSTSQSTEVKVEIEMGPGPCGLPIELQTSSSKSFDVEDKDGKRRFILGPILWPPGGFERIYFRIQSLPCLLESDPRTLFSSVSVLVETAQNVGG